MVMKGKVTEILYGKHEEILTTICSRNTAEYTENFIQTVSWKVVGPIYLFSLRHHIQQFKSHSFWPQNDPKFIRFSSAKCPFPPESDQ